ncbi:MAG: hydrolase [Bacteroidales bacterium]|nr:hydrolase [Bacteroidales bacterium]
MQKELIIAVDFDGTIVEHRYPEIGKEMSGAFQVLRELQEAGHKLILWTYREGHYLDEAVEYCLNNGIMFYAINHSDPNEEYNKYISRKIHADIFIDDRNIGGFLGWENIRKILLPELYTSEESENKPITTEKKSFFKRLFS